MYHQSSIFYNKSISLSSYLYVSLFILEYNLYPVSFIICASQPYLGLSTQFFVSIILSHISKTIPECVILTLLFTTAFHIYLLIPIRQNTSLLLILSLPVIFSILLQHLNSNASILFFCFYPVAHDLHPHGDIFYS